MINARKNMVSITKRKFLKLCSLFGITAYTAPAWVGCDTSNTSIKILNGSKFDGKVLIIGAGAAGITAGYLLSQQGIDFQIIEVSPSYGGRMKRDTSFADFPISLGAEWLHTDESELAKIVNDESVQIKIKTQSYNRKDQLGFYENGKLSLENLGRFNDRKFVNSSWLDFFEEYIVPKIVKNILFDTEIISVDYQAQKVVLRDRNGMEYVADKVIFTAPLQVLKDTRITFTPPLSYKKQNAINSAKVWGGIKVFIEFSNKFYPTFLELTDSETKEGQRVYYDASYAQNTNKNILGLFAVGTQAKPYLERTGEDLKQYILDELDLIYDGVPSSSYIKHIEQNWEQEPFINSAYLSDFSATKISSVLAKSIQNKIFFAGEAYTREDDWGSVHNAARSARDVVNDLLLTSIT